MEDWDAAIADALEALHMNQTALRAAVEEVSTWIGQRGAVSVHHDAMTVMETLDLNASALSFAKNRLRI